MPYIKTTWKNGQAPAINAENLNKIENGIAEAFENSENAKALAEASKTASDEANAKAGTSIAKAEEARQNAQNAATEASNAKSKAENAEKTAGKFKFPHGFSVVFSLILFPVFLPGKDLYTG